jgi:outer membrane protein
MRGVPAEKNREAARRWLWALRRSTVHVKSRELQKELWIRMKRLLAFVVTLASGLALSAAAQTTAAPAAATAPAAAAPAATAPASATAKVAVIAFQMAVAQTNEGQRDFADLQKKYEPKQQQLKTLSEEVDSLTKQLADTTSKMTDAERAAKQSSLDSKKKQLERDSDDAKSDFQSEVQTVYNSLASKVYDAMQSYAEKEGFTLVLDVSETDSPVLYATQGTNITKGVIDAYNAKSGVPAPAATSQTTTPKATTPASTAPKTTTPATKPATK